MDSSNEFAEQWDPHEDKEPFPHGPWFLIICIAIFLYVLVIATC